MKMWHVWTGMVIIFISGIAIGSVATFILSEPDEAEVRVDGLMALKHLTLNHLSLTLDLTPEQRPAFEKLVLKGTMRVLEWAEEMPPDIESIIIDGLEEAATFLEEAQIKKLENIYNRMKRLREQVIMFFRVEIEQRIKELSEEN